MKIMALAAVFTVVFCLSACGIRINPKQTDKAVNEADVVVAAEALNANKAEKLFYPSGNVRYEGEVENGVENGKGKVFFESGAVKNEGDFVDGKGNGKMKIYFEDGTLYYDGDVKDNNVTGTGKLYQQGKLYYEGQFLENKFHGTGKMYDTSSGELIYEGNFENNHLATGKSFMKNEKNDEIRYEGKFTDSARSDGVVVWIADVQGGQGGKYYINDVLRYEGDFTNGIPNGIGTIYDEQGNVLYSGDIEQGKPVETNYGNGGGGGGLTIDQYQDLMDSFDEQLRSATEGAKNMFN